MNTDLITYYVLSAIAVLIILAIHEYAHAYAAYKLGDRTAESFGRLTINPIKHIDPVGALCMLFFHVGWAKPVPVNPRNLKKPKRDFALVSLAGPLSNLVLGFSSAALYLLILKIPVTGEGFLLTFLSNIALFLYLFVTINIGLGIFNLLPIPPFDGSRLLGVILPEKAYFAVMKNERKIYLFVLLWLILGDSVTYALRSVPLIYSTPWLYYGVGIFSLSDILGFIVNGLTELIFKFWQLIPFLKI